MKSNKDIYQIHSPQLCMRCANKELRLDIGVVGYKYVCSDGHSIRKSGYCKGYISESELKRLAKIGEVIEKGVRKYKSVKNEDQQVACEYCDGLGVIARNDGDGMGWVNDRCPECNEDKFLADQYFI